MFQYKDTKIIIVQGDITEQKVDAVVNAANSTLLGGGGVDGAIHRVGGKEILKQCKKIGGCPTGESRITTAGKMPCKYVIHTVGPIYKDGKNRESELLYNAYYNSLILAKEYNLKSIAFPSISTGAYGYPKDEAADIAIEATLDYIKDNNFVEEITFVLFNEHDYQLYEEKLISII